MRLPETPTDYWESLILKRRRRCWRQVVDLLKAEKYPDAKAIKNAESRLELYRAKKTLPRSVRIEPPMVPIC